MEWVLGQSPCRPGTGAEQGPRVRGGRWEGPEDTPPTSAAPGGLGDTTSGRGQQGAEVQTPQAEVRWDGAPSWRWRPAPQALPVGSVGGQRRAGPIGSGGAEPNVRARVPRPQELAAHAAGIRGGACPPRCSGDRGVASGRYPTETQGVCGLRCGRAWLYQPGRSQRRLLPGQSHRPRLPLGQPRGEGTAPGGAWGLRRRPVQWGRSERVLGPAALPQGRRAGGLKPGRRAGSGQTSAQQPLDTPPAVTARPPASSPHCLGVSPTPLRKLLSGAPGRTPASLALEASARPCRSRGPHVIRPSHRTASPAQAGVRLVRHCVPRARHRAWHIAGSRPAFVD